MTLALLCSGQGNQNAHMFSLTSSELAAAELFAHAKGLLGRGPLEILQHESDDALHQNKVGQVLCTLQPLAAVAALGDALPQAKMIAGYSVGEVAAWSVAGLIGPSATLDLAAQRAEAMDAASGGDEGLIFVRGFSRGKMDELCARHGGAIAIVNPGDAFVIGGALHELDALAEAARAGGATRVVSVGVKVASHTRRLAAASIQFREILSHIAVKPLLDAQTRLFSGIDGASVLNIPLGLDKLARQISETVQWADCLEACVEAGASGFFELGPGKALSEMAANAYSHLPSRSLEDFKSLDGARAWLKRFPGA